MITVTLRERIVCDRCGGTGFVSSWAYGNYANYSLDETAQRSDMECPSCGGEGYKGWLIIARDTKGGSDEA